MLDTLVSMGGLSLLFTSTNSFSTSMNILFFWITWSSLLLAHPPIRVEIVGSAVIRIIFFWLPSLLFLVFDALIPSLAQNIKIQGARGVAVKREDVFRRARVALMAATNMALALAVQGGFEYLLVEVLRRKSALKIASTLPLPGEIIWCLFRGQIMRECLTYYIQRFMLHNGGAFSMMHWRWQHRIQSPWSVVAHYDHPIPYIFARFLPVYLPAVLFRFHLLTWYLFLAFVSIEEIMTYSGYSAVYSFLGGATRRTDRHFETGGKGNYSPWGLLDWLHGTIVSTGVQKDETPQLNVPPLSSIPQLEKAKKSVAHRIVSDSDSSPEPVRKRGRTRSSRRRDRSP